MDKLVFYSGSSFAPPTRGIHESGTSATYTELAGYSGWRRMLSNFDTSESFEWDGFALGFDFPTGTRWKSIEHVFQGAKASLVDLNAGMRFTLTYGDYIGRGEGSIAQIHRRLKKLTPAQIERWDTLKVQVLETAAFEKYHQNIESPWAQMLRATKKAQLWHLQRTRCKPSVLVRFEHLELIRLMLPNGPGEISKIARQLEVPGV